ncbi:hypothetical protein ACFLSP_01460 [Bacteroidota bacterium]
MIQRLILALALLIFFPAIQAQEVFRRFSTDQTNYPEELMAYMGLEAEEVIPEAVQSIIQLWGEGSIPDTNKSEIIIISNQLLNKNARPRPQYMTFLEVLHLFNENPQNVDNQRAWIVSMLDFSGAEGLSLPVLQDYMLFARDLLASGTVSKTNSTRWVSSNRSFKLEYSDSVRLYIDQTDLTCYAVRDSIRILQTSGVFNPISYYWSGKEGRVTWERSGYEGDQVYAELENYGLNFRFSELHVDTANYFNKTYFDFAIPGRLEYRAERIIDESKANYPSFTSFFLDYSIPNIYQSVDFAGGISMLGSKMVGSGNVYNKARLKFLRRDTLVIVARSEAFYFDQERLNSMNSEISLYMGMDSIYHPSTGMEYNVDENRISFFRTQSFQSESPYYNSYHKVEMNFELLTWNLDDDLILFKMREGAATGLANFQSDNLFDARTYFRIQGIDDENVLVKLRRYSEAVFDITFRADDFARYARAHYNQMQQTLIRLSVLGFINYDFDREIITLRQKLYDWIYASVNSIDYDVIDLLSETSSPLENASLNLGNNDLNINGIKAIQLSNAQAVYIFPENQTITMKRNRDFVFNGVINAGLFTFHGKNFIFEYDKFKINLTNIDSLNLLVEGDEFDAYGQVNLESIESVIQNMSGELLIDYPENKSGRQNIPAYPIFRSTENSFIYYDAINIQKGVYTRDDFYFEVYPFTFDSLDNFNKSGLNLEGMLHSADIFPDFEHRVYVQPDNSLGFSYKTAEDGFELYRGKGHYNNLINLSNAGFRGSGDFTYLTSRTRAEDIIFHPDSLMTNATEFEIQQKASGVQYPLVSSAMSDLQWYPYRDTMMIDEGERPFTIMNDSTMLSGSLLLTPVGLSGEGRMDLTNSILESDHFTYTAHVFDSDTANFRLKSVSTDGFTLRTDNIRAHVDFEDRSGIFQTNEEFSLVEFPENKYVSRLDMFSWDMDAALLAMGSASETDTIPEISTLENGEDIMVGPRYISIDPYQDSLSFVSNRAVYDYQRNILRGSHVTFLRVADAYIYPGDGEVIIDPNGEMREFVGAKILANRTSRLHEFYDAGVKVIGKNEYTGSGFYDYVNVTGESQQINFHEISIDDSVNTIAEGMIAESVDFTLSPMYGYQGRVELFARNNFLTFDGGAKIFYDCPDNENNFLKFRTEIDPENIYIPVPEQPTDINMNYIYSAIYLSVDSAHVYPAFNGRKKLPRDRAIVTAEGYLHYDEESAEYRIASREKLDQPGIPGNYLRLSTNDCMEYGEGKVRPGVVLGQVRTSAVGDVKYNIETREAELNIALLLDFFMSDDAFGIMTNEIDSFPNLEAVDLTDPAYMKKLSELVGGDRAETLQTELGLYGAYQSEISEINKSLFFSHLKLLWNQETQSYRSDGKISLGGINGKQVNKKIDGIIEMQKKRSGDLLDIYLELDNRHWYYFGYTRGVMHCLSSNREFNTTISAIKTKDRKMKTPKNQVPFIFITSTAQKKAMFLRRFVEQQAPVEE